MWFQRGQQGRERFPLTAVPWAPALGHPPPPGWDSGQSSRGAQAQEKGEEAHVIHPLCS